MEEESQSRQEEPSEFIKKTDYYPAPEPRVTLVLMVMLGFSLLFSMGGAMLFQGIALLAGWDSSAMSGILAPDAPPAERWQIRLLLGISHLATFILAGWATVRLFYPPDRAALAYLRADRRPEIRTVLAGVFLILVSMPLVLFVYQINKALPLPESFRLLEDQTNDAIKGLLQMENPLELIANLTLIALLPAIGEELVFRGVVQQQLLRRIHQPWIALVLTAVIFSFIHFQFEGFLPRMLLGLLLGWLYWRTGNFWVPVAAHFANNGAQVLGQFLYNHDLSSIDMEEDVDIPWYAAAISVLLIWSMMRMISNRKQEV
jgi:membrane protease YdiL (CAAX protease family)